MGIRRDRFGRFAPKSGNIKPKSKKRSAAKGNNRKSPISVVPYTRVSLRSTTAGVNAGTRLPTLGLPGTKRAKLTGNKRISAGFYVRLERETPNKLEKKISGTYAKGVEAAVKRISPSEKTDPYVRKAIQTVAKAQINKKIGRQFRIPGSGSAFARAGTSRSGTPSVILRKGRSRVSDAARAQGISDYNSSMKKKQAGRKVKPPVARAQRRRKEGR